MLTYFIYKKHTGHKLGDSLINVSADYFIDLIPQLVGNFRLFRLHKLSHHAHDILSTLRSGVCDVEIVQCHVLYYLFLLVHLTFGYWYIFLSFQVELCSICVRPSNPLACSSVGFYVNHIAYCDSLLLYRLINRGVKPQLFDAFV